MIFKSLIVVVAAALAASAQSTTSSSAIALPSGISACILSCSDVASAASGCGSYANITCACTSPTFQSAASACLQANCTTADIATAQQIQQAECATISSSASSTATSGTSSSTSSGAAAGLVHLLALDGAFGGLVALAGTFIGAALIL